MDLRVPVSPRTIEQAGGAWLPSYLARTGIVVFAMLFTIAPLAERPAAGRALVAAAASLDLPALHEVATLTLAILSPEVVVAGVESAPDPPPALTPIVVAPIVAAPPVAVAPPVIVAPPVLNDAIVLASWYGPGFYGNRTACGQTYTPEILGVAHLSLPCGTLLTLTYGSRSMVVAVIDRGPYVVGRTLDLSNATKIALGCTDLCTLRMQLGR